MGGPMGYSINSETDIRRNQNHRNEKIITYFVRFRKSYSKIRNLYYIYNLNCKRLADLYVSLADSRAKGFRKWADVHQPEKLGGARAGADEGSVIAAPDLDQEVTAPAEQPHRPWLAGAGTL